MVVLRGVVGVGVGAGGWGDSHRLVVGVVGGVAEYSPRLHLQSRCSKVEVVVWLSEVGFGVWVIPSLQLLLFVSLALEVDLKQLISLVLAIPSSQLLSWVLVLKLSIFWVPLFQGLVVLSSGAPHCSTRPPSAWNSNEAPTKTF